MKPALVVLAAGASRRLGRCKALVELGGRTALERLLEAGACLDEAAPLVVTGAHHAEIARAAPPGCRLLHNPDWSLGRSAGVVLAHLASGPRALCLAPVDVPLVPHQVFLALARKWDELGTPERGWLAPRLDLPGHPGSGRHGHPVVVGPALLDLLGGLGRGQSLRQLRRLASPLDAVGVSAPEILDDLDEPKDLARMLARGIPRP